MKEKELIPFAPILVESTRSIGYSFESALADVMDNSISATARNVSVLFKSIGDPYICIIDNGKGMTELELESAMRYGSQSPLEKRSETDLGRFGLGLKMASLSQCRQLTVVTKQGSEIFGARWDLDKIIEAKDWILLQLEREDFESIPCIEIFNKLENGAMIVWRNFDRIDSSCNNFQKIFDEKIENAREHVSLVFHRFMEEKAASKKLTIDFNGDKVIPLDPFLIENTSTQPQMEQCIRIEDSEIIVKPFILPYVSKLTAKDIKSIGGKDDLRQKQGFYVYRNKRLIIWGTWFKLLKQHELNKLARVRVDIPNSLDYIWEIDVKKSTASLPDGIKRNLISIVENVVGKSERVHTYRGRAVGCSEIEHIWEKVDVRGKFKYIVNKELPLYKIIEAKLDEETARHFAEFMELIENEIPYQAIYCDKAKNQTSIEDEVESFDVAYDKALSILDGLKKMNSNYKFFISQMSRNEYFIKYPEVVARIKEEFEND